MDEQIQFLQTIWEKVAEFLVNYSFQVVGAIIILIVGFVVAGWTAKAVAGFCRKRHFDETLTRFSGGIVKLIIVGFAVIIALGKFGITITPFVAAIGALAFGSTMAIQGPLSNFGAGLSILLSRPFKVGDTITVTGVTGVVEEVMLAATVLSNEDGERITIPNKHIVGEVLRNSQGHSVVESQVGVGYGDDIERAIRTVKTALQQIPQVAQAPAPVVGIQTFGDSSVNLGLRYWVPTKQYFQVSYAANLAIFNALKREGITMPFPQREVRLLSRANGEPTLTGAK